MRTARTEIANVESLEVEHVGDLEDDIGAGGAMTPDNQRRSMWSELRAAIRGTDADFVLLTRRYEEMLAAHDRDYVAIDADVDAVAAGRSEGYPTVFGDVSHPELIDRLKLGQPSAFILTMDNPVLVNRLARRLRDTFPDLPIVARARDTVHAAALYKAGVTDAVPETLEASLQLSEAALVDLGVAMGPVIASIHEKRAELRGEIMAEAEMSEEPTLGRRRLRDSAPSPRA